MGKRGFPWSWGCNSSPQYRDVTTINYLGVFSDKFGNDECQFKLYCDGYGRPFYAYVFYRQFILRVFHRKSTVEDIDDDKWADIDWKNETYDQYASTNKDIDQRPHLYYDWHEKRNDRFRNILIEHNKPASLIEHHMRWTRQFPSFVKLMGLIRCRPVHISNHNAFYFITRSFEEGLRIKRIRYEVIGDFTTGESVSYKINNSSNYFMLSWNPYHFGYTREGITYKFESIMELDTINELLEMLKSIIYQQRIEFFDFNYSLFKKDMKSILGIIKPKKAKN